MDAMLATLTDRRDFGAGWLLERKLDGERCLATRGPRGAVGLRSRTDRDLTATYPEVAAAVGALPGGALILDGELVAFDGETASFSRLQQRLGVSSPSAALIASHPVVLCAFDVLEVDGEDLRPLGLAERRGRLEAVLAGAPADGALRITEAWEGDSERRFAAACAAGWEGLIAKRAGRPYRPGRSNDWLKLKCAFEQELVVGGWTDPAGSRVGLGALLVGYHEDGVLRYAGKVGTGFDVPTLRRLRERLDALATGAPPFADARPVPRGTHWVRPDVVAQIAFAEWTTAGRLRQPRFLGLRDDKRPEDVVRERAVER